MAYHSLPLKKAKKQGEKPLPSLSLGLGELCSKIRPLCYAPMLPTTRVSNQLSAAMYNQTLPHGDEAMQKL